MTPKITLYRENEKRINRLYLYLICGVLAIGIILIVLARMFTPLKTFFSYWYALYLFVGGAALISIPVFLIHFQPDNRVTKYFLIGSNIGIVVFANILLAKISENNFMNFFWAVVFSTLYFNKKIIIFAVTGSAISYLLLVIFIPAVRPAGYLTFQLSVLTKLFYLFVAGMGCFVITQLANHLLQRIVTQDQTSKVNLSEISKLLKEITGGGINFGVATDELCSYIEETGASLGTISTIVQEMALDATNTREGMTKIQQILISLTERTGAHRDLTEQTVRLTENIVATSASGSENVLVIGQEINNVASQFGFTLETIEELNRDSQHIGEIVQTISNIAEQTKMLSMNAAIEAARAGEYGRGFAVVASKINKLSVQTQETLKQIEAIIKKFLPQLATTVTRTKETAIVLEKGIQNVNQINESFTQINHTLQEGLPILQNVSEFIKSQAEIIKVIGVEVTNAYDFSVTSERGMKELNEIFTEINNMSEMLTDSSQKLRKMAENLATQTKTKLIEIDLQPDEVEIQAEESPKPAADTINLAELDKSLGEFDTEDLSEFDLEAFEHSLSEIES